MLSLVAYDVSRARGCESYVSLVVESYVSLVVESCGVCRVLLRMTCQEREAVSLVAHDVTIARDCESFF